MNNDGPEIDGIAGRPGDLVFRLGGTTAPWWIVEWQPDNGESFVLVNATGNIAVAGADELTRDFRKAR